ncbi:putative DNA-binding domain-containing protein [Pseudoalteromonas luteoviolacea]|uniref:HvfC/BufC N-terminal domain-containing protein n=1 Tax=Pseudoalteromonas luteoviolacea TaxID=43657 RepID=UPI001B38FB08|nr:DNA-binding domain-containing protein [Pseudoalteromonas luteoviolacea]MBQ4811557.1 putative DNA-binding domain-containing protein [Pseudoalteromonas luteoviolacea]
MTSLEQLQKDFVEMLSQDSPKFEAHIAAQSGLAPQQRAEIYQNAYRIRLTKVLEQDHEMLGLYLGDDLFEEMVKGYLAIYPSCAPSLREFGNRLPHFLSSQSPFKEHGILQEIALFERLLLRAFDAADSDTLQFTQLQSIQQTSWPNIQFQLHPSVQLLTCHYPAVESWQALKSEQSPPSPENTTERYWIIAREQDKRTGFYALSKCHYECLKSIQSGLPFGFVCETAAQYTDSEEQGMMQVMELLQKGIELGWLQSNIELLQA